VAVAEAEASINKRASGARALDSTFSSRTKQEQHEPWLTKGEASKHAPLPENAVS
jgi:hypothetical protein